MKFAGQPWRFELNLISPRHRQQIHDTLLLIGEFLILLNR